MDSIAASAESINKGLSVKVLNLPLYHNALTPKLRCCTSGSGVATGECSITMTFTVSSYNEVLDDDV